MDPGEVLAVLGTLGILFVVFPAVLINGIAKVKAAKASARGGGDALRMSELHALIEDAVARETAHLRARVETLEAIATARDDDVRLLEAPPAPRVALPEPADEEAAAPRPRARA
jgi:hypothetical protein